MKITKQLESEKLFVIIGFVFGLALIFINPPFHSADESRHFIRAYTIAEGNILPPANPGNLWGSDIPKSIVQSTEYAKVRWINGERVSKAKLEADSKLPLQEDVKQFENWEFISTSPIPFLPFSFGIFIGKIIYSSPLWILWFARITGLIFYLFVLYYSIKIAPIFKSVFFLYGLTPIVLFQGCSVTYDLMTNALTFLMLALFLKYALEKDSPLTLQSILFILFVILIQRYAKGRYFLIPFLFYLIPIKKVGKVRAIAVGIILILINYLPDYTWGSLINAEHYQQSVIAQKDFIMDGTMNLHYFADKPMKFIDNLFSNIIAQRNDYIRGIIGRFGHSYLLFPDWVFILHGFALIFTAFFDSKKECFLSPYQKTLLGTVGIGTCLIYILGLYIYGSPVGADAIFGIQGRYFIPAVPIILLLLYNNKFDFSRWDKKKLIFLSAYSSLILLYTVFYISNYCYIP